MPPVLSLEELLRRRPELWRGGVPAAGEVLPTGWSTLDAFLPQGGWPQGRLCELLAPAEGLGALRLLLPALTRLSREEARWVAWVAPPRLPYAPALAAAGLRLERMLLVHPRGPTEALWAAEQALRGGGCSAVLLWTGADTTETALRRLALAAEAGQTWGVLLRPAEARRRPSPAALRLLLEAGGKGVHLRVLKGRGPLPRRPLAVRNRPRPLAPGQLPLDLGPC